MLNFNAHGRVAHDLFRRKRHGAVALAICRGARAVEPMVNAKRPIGGRQMHRLLKEDSRSDSFDGKRSQAVFSINSELGRGPR